VQVDDLKGNMTRLTPAFYFRSAKILSKADYLSAKTLRVYNGGGYAHDFDVKNATSFDVITKLLQKAAWLDGATRMAVVEFSLYNPSTDLLATAFFMVRATQDSNRALLDTCAADLPFTF
jgi:Polycystin cation channel